MTIWVVLFTIATAYSFNQIERTKHDARQSFANAIYENCYRTNVLLTKLIEPGIQNTSKLTYYKTHPDEKQLVLAQIHQALKLANPSHCDKLPIAKFTKPDIRGKVVHN